MATFAHENFERIAASLDTEVEEITKRAELFEGAARWYRLDRNRHDRSAPSILCRKLDQIAKRACRLLESLGIDDASEAADGPPDPEILDAMILVGERDAIPVFEATQRIGLLVEIMEAVAAASELSRRASKAATEAAAVGKLTVVEQ
jgi:hypothetical protein